LVWPVHGGCSEAGGHDAAVRAALGIQLRPIWGAIWPALVGRILTFIPPQGGHVALYVGEDSTTYRRLGGNQTDQVCTARLDKTRLRAVRQPLYKSMPSTVKPDIVKAHGGISTDAG